MSTLRCSQLVDLVKLEYSKYGITLAGRQANLDVLAVFGLRADGFLLLTIVRYLRTYFRTVMMPHAFGRGSEDDAKTKGPEILTGSLMYRAKTKRPSILISHEVRCQLTSPTFLSIINAN